MSSSFRRVVRFSIIIPAYFSSKFITKLLSTIPTRDDIEVIVVDDSLDATEHQDLQRVVSVAYPQGVVIKNSNAKGVCGARNTGIAAAKGVWIIFADSDDCFYADALAAKMDEYASSSVDQVMFRYDSKFIENDLAGGRHKHAEYILKKYGAHYPLVVLLDIGTVCIRFIRRSVILHNSLVFRDTYHIAEDALFMTEVSLKSTSYVLDDEVLYTVYDREDSVTRQMSYGLFKNWLDAQHARNQALRAYDGELDYNKVKQTRLVILLKALRQLGLKKAIRLNRYARSLRIPLVRVDEVQFLLGKLWR